MLPRVIHILSSALDEPLYNHILTNRNEEVAYMSDCDTTELQAVAVELHYNKIATLAK